MKVKGEIPDIGKCGLCHLSILHVDDYVRVTEYLKGKFHSEGFYHRNCFRTRMQGSPEIKSLQGMAANILSRANKVLDERGI